MTDLLPDLADLRAAATIVAEALPATPQYRWPLLERAAGTAVWVKHENHTPVGAFKVRGGLVYVRRLLDRGERPAGLVSATRGNHGQSLAVAGARYGLPVTIVVPHGNSREKNAAMRALGATLVEHGEDFQESREHAGDLAGRDGLHMVPSFHRDLVAGVGTYALELFEAAPDLDRVYVPIGLGSGACGLIAARDALGLSTAIVGVVSSGAPAYALSLAAGAPVEHPVTTRLADGMACRTPDPDALTALAAGLDHVVLVDDAQVAEAMRLMYRATHNVAEGAGAAALAALLAEREQAAGVPVGIVLTGGNVDADVFAGVLAGA
jgi:threonine dehydratase